MHKVIKRGVSILLKSLLGIVVILGLYLLVMFTLSRITVNGIDQEPTQDVAIYIKSNGVHTDIVVPVKNELKDWEQLVKPEHAADNAMQYVGFGWGDKGFYLNTPEWSDLKVSTACNAAFYLGTSAMHTTFFTQITEGPKCVKVTISAKEYRKLIEYIESGFQLDKNNNAIPIAQAAYGDHDSFYEGQGRYSLFYTCNSWANNALKAADQKAALWTLTDSGILCHYN